MDLWEFKRRVEVGQRVGVVHRLDPSLSGECTVHKVQSHRLATRDQNGDVWWTDWPSASQARIEGTTLHFLNLGRPDEIAFSYTFRFGEERQEAPEPPACDSGAVEASRLALGDMVEYDDRTVQDVDPLLTIPGGRGVLRDVWAFGGEQCARVERTDGVMDAPLLSDLRRVEPGEVSS